MTNPRTYYFELPANNRPEFSPLTEEVHPKFGWLTRNRSRSRDRDVFEVIDTIVVHATAGYATQHAIDAWHRRRASAHWVIPDENEPQHGEFTWATVAEAKAAYHVLDSIDVSQTPLGSGTNINDRSLGIEIVNTQDVQNFSDPFSDWQVRMAARIVLYAWAKYPNLKHVISHAKLDPNRRADPGSNFPWDAFKNLVLSHSGIPERRSVVFASIEPPELPAHSSGCCLP